MTWQTDVPTFTKEEQLRMWAIEEAIRNTMNKPDRYDIVEFAKDYVKFVKDVNG